MRILHTSDWHLGQSFFTKSRKNEHQAFIEWLLNLVQEQEIDAVIIAGDVFDSGTPPSYARELYNRFVVQMNAINCTLVVLGGNHDSVSMLNESKPLVECLNTHVVANTSDDYSSQIIELSSNGQIGALLCAVPFVRARDVMHSMAGSSGTQKQKQLGDAIKAHYFALYNQAKTIREQKNLAVPIITTGHLTAMGVTKADSERDIYIGSLDAFAADGFPPADYIALGHIHRPQIVAKSEHIRYCGSPIPLSFDELKFTKQVVLVEFDHETRTKIQIIEVPTFQRMAILKGDLPSIEKQLQTFRDVTEQSPVWLAVEVEVQDFLSDLQQRIQSLTEDLNVEVLQLRRARSQQKQSLQQEQLETLSELTPIDVFEKRVEHESLQSEDETARLTRITTRFEQIVAEVESGEQSE
ncbi:exonuclease subunit SbcD [Vibrio sp. TH_r3]|uniref:exonuclease subunit SbcD n=1 Tax=Vibrio sp. TH_r3 TaxID=3082084 RepID=UPI002953BC48|nr:exonuclease subunit SbcD [Vibrio sp. TH_r3]MDV7105924.1 exonuclease subunit SbcD [Vibrio sp. TH_r3]